MYRIITLTVFIGSLSVIYTIYVYCDVNATFIVCFPSNNENIFIARRHVATFNHCHSNQKFRGFVYLRVLTPEHWICWTKCWHSIQIIAFPLKKHLPIHTWNSIMIPMMRYVSCLLLLIHIRNSWEAIYHFCCENFSLSPKNHSASRWKSTIFRKKSSNEWFSPKHCDSWKHIRMQSFKFDRIIFYQRRITTIIH